MTRRRTVSWTQPELPFAPAFDVFDLPVRIASKITIDTATGCWLWTGGKAGNGYGQGWHDGVHVYAHRLTWRLLADPELPLRPGRGVAPQLDHRCRVRACVNPAHLELVTPRENVLRGRSGVLGSHRSRFVGVDRQHNRWRAALTVDNVRVNLGCFLTEHAAAVMYDAASLIAFSDTTNYRLGLLVEVPTPAAIDDAGRRLDRAAGRSTDRSAS